MPEHDAFVLQPILAPGFGHPKLLYFQAAYMAAGAQGDCPWQLDAGDQLDGNTFFNMFLPDMWSRHAKIGRLGIRVALWGRIALKLIGVDRDAGDVLLAQKTGDSDFVIWLDDLQSNIGRVYMRLTVLQETRIDRLEWVTDKAPVSDPRISVGICTFNRESFVAATLAALSRQSERTPALGKIWVVNQGKSFTDEGLLKLGSMPNIEVIEQRNLGGCGGFTRSMLEAISAKDPATHHLLMDDDIILDPRIIDRVAGFLRYRADDIVLGGQMFEIERPTVLYEAGGRLHHMWFVDPVARNLRVENPNALNFFFDTPALDYNAWWFCVIPTEAIRKVGLPPPLFIRGDDIEYGCRLREAGIETIPLIGTAIWHESFVFKTSDWLGYYDLRNRLILSMLHPTMAKPPDGLYLLGYVMSIVFGHRYRAASIALRAIDDALAVHMDGLPANSEIKHREVLALIAKESGPRILALGDLPLTQAGPLKPLDPTILGMVKMCVGAFIKLHLVRLLPRRLPLLFPRLPQASAVGARDYVAAIDPSATSYVYYQSDLGKLWRLVFRTFVMCAKYKIRMRRAVLLTPAKIDALRSQEVWRETFKIPRD